MLAIACKGLFGINVYVAFPTSWVIANFLFGVCFLVLMLWLSKRYGAQIKDGTWLKSLVDDLAGRSLANTAKFLREVQNFGAEKN